MADFENIPKDMLQEITKFLSIPDYIRFGAVCSHWLEVIKEGYYSPHKQLPWLIFFDIESPRVFNPLDEKVYRIELPELHQRHCAGSSHGWFITIDLNLNINLLNLFSKNQVKLPQLPFDASDVWPRLYYECFWSKWPEERRDQLIYKAVLSADPCKNSDYTVMAIYCCNFKLAFWRAGDITWTVIDSDFVLQDIIWFNDAFYVVGSKINSHDDSILQSMKKYLVNFMGDLLLVYRSIAPAEVYEGYYNESSSDEDEADDYPNQGNDNGALKYYQCGVDTMEFLRTDGFMLFKLDQKENKFVELKNINGHVLFLGSNHAVFTPTTTLAEKMEDNFIYFSDDYECANHMYGYRDSGVYNMRDKSITFPLNNIFHQVKQPTFIDINPDTFRFV
ncbi:F-box domain-containing protein [Dioscorea alata]|uniref:F-box domain-containing protein n=1 Tax=Dioscorea alata TaxID=55571 RepID=A0ACB7UEY0_DIOAL|nr:F-box domain-containing protein [Dioscorea alata]